MRSESIFPLIGEEVLGAPGAMALRLREEAERIWDSPDWQIEKSWEEGRVESVPVSVGQRPPRFRLMRSSGIIAGDPEPYFSFLVSPEGFSILDPVSDPRDHRAPPSHRFGAPRGIRREIAEVKLRIPGTRSFRVFNLVDQDRRLFLSKSVLYGLSETEVPERIRPFNSFGFRVEEGAPEGTRIVFFNYVDLHFPVPRGIMDRVNARFLRGLYFKIQEARSRSGGP